MVNMTGHVTRNHTSIECQEGEGGEMTQLKVRALWSLLIWSSVMIALLIIFFIGGGPSTFLDGDTRVELTRVCFSLGFGAYFFMLFLTKVKSDSGKLIKDERDDRIARHANASAFSAVGEQTTGISQLATS